MQTFFFLISKMAKDNLPGKARLVFQGRKRSVCNQGGEAVQEPYATGRKPTAAGAAARAICTVEPYGRVPCTVVRRQRR